MKSLFILSIFLLVPITDIDKIARTNDLKKKAKASFEAGNYEGAARNYHYLLDSMGINEPEITMNLANTYFHKGDTSTALNYYNQLRENENKNLASKAYQQLGVIKNKQKKKEEALSDFKQALRNDPTNEEARYNYELLKKILDEEKEQKKQEKKEEEKKDPKDKKEDQQQQQDQQQQKDQEQQQKQDQEGKEGEEDQEQKEQQEKDEQQKDGKEEQKKNEGNPDEPSEEEMKDEQNMMNISPDKLKEMNISEEKARMILEAMKNQEIQYLQQNKRKAQQRPNSNKPDW